MSTPRTNDLPPAGVSDAIPGRQAPCCMSMAELALALSLAEPGSLRMGAIERELRIRLSAEPPAPRHPWAVMFLAGALVAITAFFAGAMIRGMPVKQHVSSVFSQSSVSNN